MADIFTVALIAALLAPCLAIVALDWLEYRKRARRIRHRYTLRAIARLELELLDDADDRPWDQ